MKGGKVADSQSTPKQGETFSGRDRASRPKKSKPSPSAQSGDLGTSEARARPKQADSTPRRAEQQEILQDHPSGLNPPKNLSILQGTLSFAPASSSLLQSMRAPSSGDSDPILSETHAGCSASEPDPSTERHLALRQQQPLESRLLKAEAELQERRVLQEQLQALHQKVAEQEKALQEREHLLQQLQQTLAAQKVQISDQEAQLAARQRLNERQRQDIEALQEQIEQLRLAHAQERRQWEQRQQELQASLLEAQDVAEKRVEMLQRFKAELSLARTQIAETQAELSSLRALYSDQQAAWQEQREHLEARLAGYAETEAEAEQRWREQRQELEAALAEAQAQLAALQAQQEHLRQGSLAQQQLQQQWQAQAEALQVALSQAQAEVTRWQQEHRHLQEQYAQAQQHLSAMERQLQAALEQLAAQPDWQPQLRSAQATILHLQEEIATLSTQLEKQAEQIKALQGERAALWEENRSLREKYEQQQMHVLSLKAALEHKGLDVPPRADTSSALTRTESLGQALSPTPAAKPTIQPLAQPLPSRASKRAVDLPRFLPRP
ncbi:chromosome segregation ATPase [Thermostichus sp. OS-CIW-39]